MLNPNDFITRNAVESTSIRYGNELKDFIADYVFPPMPVGKELVKLWQYDTSNMRRRVTKKTSKSKADTLDFSGFYTSITLQLHKLQGDVDPSDEVNFDSVVADVTEETGMQIMEALMIDKEVEAATLATTATNYPADLTSTLAANATWIVEGGDPEANAKTARGAVKARCGKAANALVLSWTGLENAKQSPALKDRLKYTSGQSISEEQLKNLFGVQHLFVGAAQQNANLEGNATQTLTDIWDDSALFFVYDPSPRRKKVSYGVQPIFNQIYSHQYEDNTRGSGKGRIKVLEMGWNYKVAPGAVVSSSDTDFAAGYLLKNIF